MSDAALDEWMAFQRRLGVHQAARRTMFSSPLVPMEYQALQSLETWSRWPEIMRAVDAVLPAEEIGRHFRRPGFGVNATHFYCLGALPAGGRGRWRSLGVVADDERERLVTIADFWRRTTEAWRGDGFTTAFSAGDVVRPYPNELVASLAENAVALDDEELRVAVRRFLATLVQYLFLMYVECRIGIGDSGPYPLPGERTVIVRELSGLSHGWLPWSDVAAAVPVSDLVCVLVYRPGVQHHVTDSATTFSNPDDPFELLESVALYTSDGAGNLAPLPLDALPAIEGAVDLAQRAFYRRLVGWSWEEKVAAGALGYFTMIRPWTVAAGIVDDIDWSMPKAAADVLPTLREMPTRPPLTS